MTSSDETSPNDRTLSHERVEGGELGRRAFLGFTAAVAAGGWSARRAIAAGEGSRRTLTLDPDSPLSLVVQVEAPNAVNGAVVHKSLIREMLQAALQTVTKTPTVRDAWRTLLRDNDVVGLKFNRSGQFVIGTTPAVAGALIESLIVSGFGPERIVCLEAPAGVAERFGCRPASTGYASVETDFGSGADQLVRALDDITALINIPFLKEHNIAGLSCALKNLSHGLVKHPARFHDHGCSPYIADIVALPAIRGKLRLNLVDGLRVVFEGGPEATSHNLADTGILLASTDPVAVDSVGLNIINNVRKNHRLSVLATAPRDIDYLAVAHARGLGIAVPHGITVRRVGI